jgi:Protein of unknown function (DUF3048) N-terminal domain/Protein of unknown function (DUF3048) C-terminal domain
VSRSRWARPTRVVTLVVVGALVVAACSSGSEPSTTKRKSSTTTTTTTEPAPVAPFTGLPDPDRVAQGRSSLAVKIENTPDARPQSGLDVADIVYEEVVEGGITRFWAVFNSEAPEHVGPIRSVRAMDPLIVSPLGGVVTFSGGTEINVAYMRAAPVVAVDENNAGAAFYREPSRSAPHDLYGLTADLWTRGGQPVPPKPMFSYLEEGAQLAGDPADRVHIAYEQGYDVTYDYDPTARTWQRFQGLVPHVVESGELIQPTNVIVQLVVYGGGGEGELLGNGDALVFSEGQVVQARWTKLAPDAPTAFTDAAGTPLSLTAGRTWVELAPVGTPVEVTAPAPPAPVPSSTP